MKIRSTLSTLLLASFFFAGCSSSSLLDSAPPNLIPPELNIRELSSRPMAARHETGGIPINFQVAVANRSAEVLVLERIVIQTLGAGAYTIPATTRPFNKEVLPNKTELVAFWVPAEAEDTIVGSNGPVTIRTTAFFKSPYGRFRQIYMEQVNATARERESM